MSAIHHEAWCGAGQCQDVSGDVEHLSAPTPIDFGLVTGRLQIQAWGWSDGDLDGNTPMVKASLEHTEVEESLLLQLTAAEARAFAAILTGAADTIEAVHRG